ncbi:hypothetical protein COBT_000584 [Conglomerata obtusa]
MSRLNKNENTISEPQRLKVKSSSNRNNNDQGLIKDTEKCVVHNDMNNGDCVELKDKELYNNTKIDNLEVKDELMDNMIEKTKNNKICENFASAGEQKYQDEDIDKIDICNTIKIYKTISMTEDNNKLFKEKNTSINFEHSINDNISSEKNLLLIFDCLSNTYVNNEQKKPYFTCKCIGDKEIIDLNVFPIINLTEYYKNLKNGKKYINITVTQGYYTEITLETCIKNMDLIKNIFNKLMKSNGCNYMKHFSLYLQHIIRNPHNYYHIQNKFLETFNRKQFLYVQHKVKRKNYCNYEKNKLHTCCYTGEKIDIYISYYCERLVLPSKMLAYNKTQNYKYLYLLAKNDYNSAEAIKKNKKYQKMYANFAYGKMPKKVIVK